ncbi:hypothetical protein [Qipengyuania qiaonensis]|uniref:DUF481 domain-containing protein n=1 Tax=Qipengyuania qiaonensis TaxID=2867240 RepID=A0ABS7J6S3_9SPHN|nr:hypothetical protein [Qipengyuania qiaonensis]MBX7482643.1 hypothetical protein [Qipengyuania qiaonensis]
MALTRHSVTLSVLIMAGGLPGSALAQDMEPTPAIGAEVFVSTDSDDTDILRTAIDFDLRNAGEDDRIGVRVEKAWYDPSGTGTRERERIFGRYAGTSGDWTWSILAGTDGHTIIGSASVHDNSAFRKEVFIERDVVETPRGLEEDIYSTFVGAAIDLPLDEKNVVTLLGGVQEFSGENLRLHARANYVHVVKPEWGLSLQLRGRYFRDGEPGEFDYYSPRWYAQVMPVVQLRRFVGGWELIGAGGIGVQRDAATDWRQSNFANVRFRSPDNAQNWSVFGEAIYTDTPSNNGSVGSGYSYVQGRLGVMRRF